MRYTDDDTQRQRETRPDFSHYLLRVAADALLSTYHAACAVFDDDGAPIAYYAMRPLARAGWFHYRRYDDAPARFRARAHINNMGR